jgi:hypothetical protein
MRLASSSSPHSTVSASDFVPVARSSNMALPSWASTRAAPLPSHHTIKAPPRCSSCSVAIFSIAGAPP